MITNPSHTLIFGNITMIEQGANPSDVSGARYLVQSQDTVFGNPAPVTVALISLMRQGSLVSYDHTENREPVLRVIIEADDSDQLAQGEKALQLECEKSNTLTWIPPDGAGEPSVFDVVWSSLELVFDDVQELLRRRVYLLHLQALPHARSEDLVVTPAQATTPTFTVIDNGSAVSGAGFAWTDSSPNTTISIVSGRVRLTEGGFSVGTEFLIRTGAVSLTGAAYLAVDESSTVSGVSVGAIVDGVLLPRVAIADLGGGLTRLFFRLPAGMTSATTIQISIAGGWIVGSIFEIDQIQKVDALPFIGTARQKASSLIPGGSVITQGSIQIAHASNALGKTIIYTSPADGGGYLPPMRGFLTSSTTVTADSATLSGSRNAIVSPSIYRVPVASCPRGRTELWAWLRNPNAVTVRIDTNAVSMMSVSQVAYFQFNQADVVFFPNTWQLVLLGVFTLPPTDIGPSGAVQIQIQRGTTTETPEIDEAYLFATHDGELTIVDLGSGPGGPTPGGSSNRLWIDAPSPTQPQGGLWRGNAADRSDAWHAGYAASPWGNHSFHPSGTKVFVATNGTQDATTSLEHYRRYHTHVARET